MKSARLIEHINNRIVYTNDQFSHTNAAFVQTNDSFVLTRESFDNTNGSFVYTNDTFFHAQTALSALISQNHVRSLAWFFEQAVLDADGILAPTTGECKVGMNIGYNSMWGFHPLLLYHFVFIRARPPTRGSRDAA